MINVLSISLDFARNNRDEIIEVRGEKFHIRHVGTDYNYTLMMQLAQSLSGEYDYIALDNIPSQFFSAITLGDLNTTSKKAFFTDGRNFRIVYTPWSLRFYNKENSRGLEKKKYLFLSAYLQDYSYSTIKEFSHRIASFDPIILNNIDLVLDSPQKIEEYLSHSIHFELEDFFSNRYITQSRRKSFTADQIRAIELNDIIVADESLLIHYDLSRLKGKTVLVDYLRDSQYDYLKSVGIKNLIVSLPNTFAAFKMSNALIEVFISHFLDLHREVDSDDVMEFIDEFKIRPQMRVYNNDIDVTQQSKFAFIIHPLSRDHFFKHKQIRHLTPFKKFLAPGIEKATTYLNGFKYGRIEGICSEYDQQVHSCDIYTLFETPDMMVSAPAEKIYDKLVSICETAEATGASIIGLGAYTKVIGDAGVTVNKRSPIPVTTGNSFSAASTLWAARICAEKMGIMEVDETGKSKLPVMVVGATGSIGSVISKILCSIFHEVIIVAPRAYKLFELKDEMEKINPDCKVTATTNIEKYVGNCPLIITTTSNRGRKLLDISKVRPGAVICDVSRPFDISKEEALTRPDVLVMANGEVELPGDINITCDLGLQGKVVYACLAETALLAMEGRLESFTLSREISVQNVKDIYKMALKHGVRLAQITGPTGEITDQEIKLCRQHALKELGQQ